MSSNPCGHDSKVIIGSEIRDGDTKIIYKCTEDGCDETWREDD